MARYAEIDGRADSTVTRPCVLFAPLDPRKNARMGGTCVGSASDICIMVLNVVIARVRLVVKTRLQLDDVERKLCLKI